MSFANLSDFQHSAAYMARRFVSEDSCRGQTGGWSKQGLRDLINRACGPTPSEDGGRLPRPGGRIGVRINHLQRIVGGING